MQPEHDEKPPAASGDGTPQIPPEGPGEVPVKSYGNMSEHHWSKTRGERNAEAIDYYRQRSRAPGVAQGGEARNFYCMECDGVIPYDQEGDACPHCAAPIEGAARRYFNWVEIDRPAEGDFKAVLPFLLGGMVLVAGALWLLLALLF